MFDIKKFKSAEIISGADNIRKALEGQAEKSKQGAFSGMTQLISREDGRQGLAKQTGNLLATFDMPDSKALKDMAGTVNIPWDDGYNDRVIPWFCSDERVDRHGDIVEQSWDFGNFKNNPVMMFSHQWDGMPIGNMINWSVTNRAATANDSYIGPSLVMLGLFAKQDQSAFADQVFRLVKAGFLRTVSVGFYPGEVIDIRDDAERAELGLGPWGYVYRNNEMIELSPTSIPANAGAYSLLNSAKGKGLLLPNDLQIVREIKRIEAKDEDSWKRTDTLICSFWKAMYPAVKSPKHHGLDETLLLEEIEQASGTVLTSVQVKDDPAIKLLASAIEQIETLTNKVVELSDKVSEVRDLVERADAPPASDLLTQKGGAANQGTQVSLSAIAEALRNPQGS